MTNSQKLNCIICLIFFSIIVIPAMSTPAEAQRQGAMRWFSGELGGQQPSLQYTASGYTTRDVQGQPLKDFKMMENRASLAVPISQSKEYEWLLTGSLAVQSITTQAILPTTSDPFPGNLWDVGFGTAYRKKFENGWISGISVDFGSASDKPFFSWDEMTLSANLFTRIPHAEQNAWLFLLNYNNNREFWPNVPIPGVGYMFQKDKLYRITVGVPFLFAEVRPWKDLSMEFSYFPVRTVHGGINYTLVKDLTIYGNFDWGNDEFFRADRTDKSKRLFYYEKRLTAGLRYQFNRHCFVNLGGGYAFDRMYFEGQNYSDRDFNRLDIQDGPFGRAQIGLRY